MEIDYKTDVALTFGIFANEPLQSIQAGGYLFPNDQWNKVYINLVTEVSAFAIRLPPVLWKHQYFGHDYNVY